MVELIIARRWYWLTLSAALVRAGRRRAGIPDAICHAVVFNHRRRLGYAAGRARMVFRIYRAPAGIKRYVNAGRCGDDHGGLRPFVTFTATVATLLPSYPLTLFMPRFVGWRAPSDNIDE